MSANSGYASKQSEVRQQEQGAPAQDSSNNTQTTNNSVSRSQTNGYGARSQGGYSSYDPESGSNMNADGYNSGYSGEYGSRYGGGYGSSYGSGYGGGYGSSYGGYGGGSGYGGYSSYGSSYGSYGSGMNRYSNNYSKPINQQNGQNQEEGPPQQPPVSADVWGFLNGCHAILNILYAGTGIVQFGKMFAKMSMKIIKMVCGKSLNLVFKLTGFNFLKNIIQKMASGKDWASELSTGDLSLESEWGSTGSTNVNKSIFGKIILVTRFCSLLGAMFAWFLRNKARESEARQQTPQMEMPVIRVAEEIIPQVNAEFEGVKNLYDEVKLIGDEQGSIEDQAKQMVEAFEAQSEDMDGDGDIRAFDTFAKENGLDEVQEAVKLENAEEIIAAVETEIQAAAEKDIEIANLVANEELVEEREKILADGGFKADEEVILIREVEEAPAVIPGVEEIVVLSNNDLEEKEIMKSDETAQVEKTATESVVTIVEETAASTEVPANEIVVEDIWKKKLEEFKAEEKKKEEETNKTFELPSVLQSLREKTPTSNKPWLMKKKKAAESTTETQSPVATQKVQDVVVSEAKSAIETTNEMKPTEAVTPGNSESTVTTEDLINNASTDTTHITL